VALLIALLCWTSTSLAQSHSDLLFVVDEDGMGYTAQHVLFADNELMVSALPAGRKTLTTVFTGSGSDVYRRAHELDARELTILSGSVFTRFRHSFSDAQNLTTATTRPSEVPVRLATLDGFEITMASTRSLTYSVSWILPSNIELLSFGDDSSASGETAQYWRQEGNMITFERQGAVPAQLKLEFRVHTSGQSRANACVASLGPSEWCSPDSDSDGVPDYRDLCLAENEPDAPVADPAPVLRDKIPGVAPLDIPAVTPASDSLGCVDDSLVLLSQIQFASGQTYLNAQSRKILDKLAIALQRTPDKLFRIAAHTDNAGYVHNNQVLSDDRADAIRHYLMLRGVGPNQVQARGYGETSPAHDNRTPAGRRANRRVELHRLN